MVRGRGLREERRVVGKGMEIGRGARNKGGKGKEKEEEGWKGGVEGERQGLMRRGEEREEKGGDERREWDEFPVQKFFLYHQTTLSVNSKFVHIFHSFITHTTLQQCKLMISFE
jgi:hypothetical protein